MKRFLIMGAIALFSVTSLVACSSSDDDDEKSEKETTSSTAARSDDVKGTEVAVSLKEYKIIADPITVAPGDATFEVTNDGTIDHEFVVVKTDLADRELPVDEDGLVKEGDGGVEPLDELEDIIKGDTRNLAVELEAGKYVLFCNIAGHYSGGMSLAFEVK